MKGDQLTKPYIIFVILFPNTRVNLKFRLKDSIKEFIFISNLDTTIKRAFISYFDFLFKPSG
jgi:hypothetical protein